MEVFTSTFQAFNSFSITIRMSILAITTFLTYCLLQFLSHKLSQKSSLPLPPKPPGAPLVGNLFQVLGATDRKQQHLLFEKWAREYGEIVRVQAGPFTQYFVNSDRAVKEIFDKASAQTAERPRWIVSNEQICNQWNVLLLNGSDQRWKHQRKVIHAGMTSIPRADAGLPYLHYETARFLNDVASNPSVQRDSTKIWDAVQRYTYSTFASQTFGMDIPDANSPLIHYIHETGLAQILGTLPGYHIVDMLPIFDSLPLILKPWERSARTRFRRDLAWVTARLDRLQCLSSNNTIDGSFLSRAISDAETLGFNTPSEAAYLSLMLIIGAADTSAISTWAFLEGMLRNGSAQTTAFAAVDALVGDRLPVYEDLAQLPYIRCLMKETWRWRPPVALGHPHLTTAEIVCDGMRIPRGSRVHLNAWAIGHDPARHERPDEFLPERYEHDESSTMQSINSKDVSSRDHFAFGAGRRVCPGYHVAERSLAVAIMRILWAFEVRVAEGAKLPLDERDWAGDMPGLPGKNMPVTLVPRSEERRRLVCHLFEGEERTRTPMEHL